MINNRRISLFYNIILIVLFISIMVVIYYLVQHDNNNYEITLNGNKEIILIMGTSYVEPGYQAYDSEKNDVTNKIEVINNVDIHKIGEYTIEYRLNGRVLSTRKIKVIQNGGTNIPVTGITLDKEKVVIGGGKALTINITINPDNATNRMVTWSSSDTRVVTVDNGVIIGKNEGTATITATTSDGISASCEVVVDNTPPTINECTAYISNNLINYTIEAYDTNGISKYVHDEKIYYSNKISVSRNNEDNIVKVYDNLDNYSEIVCRYGMIEETKGANVISRYNSKTLKYWIEKPATYYTITHIWVDDVYQQLKVVENQNIGTLEMAKTMLDREINRNNYHNKGMIAINASGAITATKTSDDFWNYNGWSTERFSSRAPLIISQGAIVRDFTNYELPSSLYPLYGIKKNGYLSSYTFYSGSGGINKNKQVVSKVQSDGVKNTFSFNPRLIVNYQDLVQSKTSKLYIEPNVRQAICQIDMNNFVIVSNIVSEDDSNNLTQQDRDNGLSHKDMASLLMNQGCKTAYNLDGGGSVNFFYKGNTSTINSINKSSRLLADVLYFVEK